MTNLDPSTCVLSPRDQPVLDALRIDRDASGPGVSRAEVERLGDTRHPNSLIGRLRKQGHVIGVVGGLYQLGEEPASTEASGERRPAIVEGSGPASAGTLGQASDASVSAVQPLFELRPVSAIDPMLDEAA